jgi:hypothetical protein
MMVTQSPRAESTPELDNNQERILPGTSGGLSGNDDADLESPRSSRHHPRNKETSPTCISSRVEKLHVNTSGADLRSILLFLLVGTDLPIPSPDEMPDYSYRVLP